MRLFVPFAILLLAAGCGGGHETAREEPAATAPGESAATPRERTGEELDLMGSATIARVIAPEWRRVEELTQQFYEGRLEELYAGFSGGYKEEFSLEDLTLLRDGMLSQFGEEVEVVSTRIEEKQGYSAFFRVARFSADERLIEIAFLIGPDESIAGLFVTPDRTAQSPAQ